jgi:hypothetical protein
MRSNTEIQEWIQEKKESYDFSESRLHEQLDNDASPGSLTGRYQGLYLDAVNIATYSLTLDDVPESQTWFGRSATHVLGLAELVIDNVDEIVEDDPRAPKHVAQHRVNGLFSACLSSNTALLEEVATRTRARHDVMVDLVREVEVVESQMIAACVLDDEDVEDLADRLVELADEFDQYHTTVRPGQSRALARTCRGIVREEPDSVAEGAGTLIAAHEEDIDDDPRGHREVVCHPAAALIVLARQRGLNVRVDSEYVPEAVYDLA